MSIPFSNTTTKNGIIQLIERNLSFPDAGISSNSTLFAQFTGDVNIALDKVLSLIFQVGGTWQFDDSNHSDHPIITTDLVSGQRDYSFTSDGSGNLILQIYKVLIADAEGNFREVFPTDVPSGAPSNYWDGLDVTGSPITYDKLGNGIFIDPPANYNSSGGLKIYINREGSYFTTADTTKKPGFAGLFHEYLALRPSYMHAFRKSLPIRDSLEKEMLKMEADIMDYYKSREKDVNKTMRGAPSCSR